MIHRIVKYQIIIGLLILSACIPNSSKVRIDYRRAPIVEDIAAKRIALWRIIQKDTEFDASRDLESVFLKEIKSQDSLKQFQILKKDALSFSQTEEGKTALPDQVRAFDWITWNQEIQVDLVILGELTYEASDFSGYDSEWKINRYGYRVPSKVWKDRTSYKFKLNLMLVDTAKNEIVIEKTYDADQTTEGAADEVGVFFDLSQRKIRAFLDFLVGKKVNAIRYLMNE